MISHDYKCIFIHIPKCAGTSVENVLGHFDDYNGRGRQDHRSIRMIQKPFITKEIFKNKENFKEFFGGIKRQVRDNVNPRNKYTVTRKHYNEYFKFTIVRNPWARVYSWYKNVLRDTVHRQSHNISTEISFEDFVKENIGQGMLRPQTYWLQDYQGNIPMDYIIKFENLEEGFQEVCKKLEIDDITLPHELQSSTTNYRDFYSKSLKKIVENYYQKEIELFNYSFE